MESFKQPQEDPFDTVYTKDKTHIIMEEEKEGGELGQDLPPKTKTTTTTNTTTTTTTRTMEEEEKEVMA
jgi:hypothetical protein